MRPTLDAPYPRFQLRTRAGTIYTEISGYKYMVESVAGFGISNRNALDLSGLDCIRIKNSSKTQDLALITERTVWIYPGYCWNGADWASDKNFLDGSLIHDLLCQAMNSGLISPSNHKNATAIMTAENKRSGMNVVRLCYTRASVNAHWKHKVKSMPWPADAI